MSLRFRGIATTLLVSLASCQDQLTSPTLPLEAAKDGKPTPPPCGGLPGGTSSVVLTPSSAVLEVGGTVVMIATNQAGTPIPACALKWSSDNTLVATVSATGEVLGVAPGGPVTIKAQTGGKKPLMGKATVTVVDLTVVSVTVSPSSATIDPGATIQLVAVARNAGGNELTGKTVAWSSANSAVATVSGTGLVTGVGGGAVDIAAEVDGKSGTASVRVVGWLKLADAPLASPLAPASVFDPAGRSLYMILTNDYNASGPDVWRFDLVPGTWSHLAETQPPVGKYRQFQFDPSNGGRIVTFWDGLGPVYAVAASGGAWAGLGGGGEGQDYYEGASFIDPVTGRLSLLMGYGGGIHKNTFWQFDGSSWGLRAPSGTVPSARMGPRLATDAPGQRVFMVSGHVNVSYSPTDVWKLDLATLTWTNVLPDGQGPQAKFSFAGYVASLNRLYVYGGSVVSGGAHTSQMSSQLWYVDLASPVTVAVPTAGASPGARWSNLSQEMHYDAVAHRLLLVGGMDVNEVWHKDIWAYYLP